MSNQRPPHSTLLSTNRSAQERAGHPAGLFTSTPLSTITESFDNDAGALLSGEGVGKAKTGVAKVRRPMFTKKVSRRILTL